MVRVWIRSSMAERLALVGRPPFDSGRIHEMKPCQTCRFLRDHFHADSQPSGKKLCAEKASRNYVGIILKDLNGCEQHKENEHERDFDKG